MIEYITYKNKIAAIANGEEVGEVTFPMTGENIHNINHTYVDNRLRGQGIASKLVAKTVDEIHRRGGKATATCTYAKAWLERHPQKQEGSIS